jgi:hypothetical protein
MLEGNIPTSNPGWDSNAQKPPAFTDVRELQRTLKAQFASRHQVGAGDLTSGRDWPNAQASLDHTPLERRMMS